MTQKESPFPKQLLGIPAVGFRGCCKRTVSIKQAFSPPEIDARPWGIQAFLPRMATRSESSWSTNPGRHRFGGRVEGGAVEMGNCFLGLPSSKRSHSYCWNIPIFNRKYIFNPGSIFQCYVRLPECNGLLTSWLDDFRFGIRPIFRG